MDNGIALEWRWSVGSGTKQIRIEGQTLLATDSRCQPDTSSFSLGDAFGDARSLLIDRPEILAEVLRALAARLGEHDLSDVQARRRRAFWLALEACPPLQLRWPAYPPSAQPPVVTLDVSRVSALCTAPLPDTFSDRKWQSLDDLFFYGPLEPGIPAAARADLIKTILSALKPESGLDASHAFPEVDHARIAPASWSWDVRNDGESSASIEGPCVFAGYRYGHDYGYSVYSAERVLTGAPELGGHAPPEVVAAIVEALRVAVV